MNTWVSWWHQLSAPAKFRRYTQFTFQLAIGCVAIAMAIASHTVWAATALLLSAAAALAVIQTETSMSAWATPRLRRAILPTAAVIQLIAVLVCAAVARLAPDRTAETARTTAIFVFLFAGFSVIPFLRHKWWIALALSAGFGLLFGTSVPAVIWFAASTFIISAIVVSTTLAALWSLRVVDELERTRTVEAQLRVAEERLRFSRDLHDVVGRGFSAVAVKSELAATLSRAGAAERAASEMDEVNTLAIESLGQLRELVRGYRDINLDSEIAGARSLLAAAGCELTVSGSPATVPSRLHEAAAWVVREGTTNIVRHSMASAATLSLGTAAMSLRNNGVTKPTDTSEVPAKHSGLRGLSERLAAYGATLRTSASGDTYALEITWGEI